MGREVDSGQGLNPASKFFYCKYSPYIKDENKDKEAGNGSFSTLPKSSNFFRQNNQKITSHPLSHFRDHLFNS